MNKDYSDFQNKDYLDLHFIYMRLFVFHEPRPEIPDFLSEDECDHIISLASENELFKSEAKGGLTEIDNWKFDPKRK